MTSMAGILARGCGTALGCAAAGREDVGGPVALRSPHRPPASRCTRCRGRGYLPVAATEPRYLLPRLCPACQGTGRA